MKTWSQNSIKVIVILLTFSAPLFMNNSWKKPAKPTFKERAMAEAEAGKKVAVFTNLTSVGYKNTADDEDDLCKIGTGLTSSVAATYTYKAQLGQNTPVAYDVSSVVAEQLNQGMNTDVFVPVAQNGVGSKTVKALGINTKIQDWWNSDYDVIVEIVMTAAYETTKSSSGSYKTSLVVAPLMYVREVVEGKEALGFIVNGRSLGNNSSSEVHNACFSSLKELIDNVGAPDDLVEKTKEGISAPLTKFIGKENSKYEKAMKKKKKK